jgi:hypothetical protein
VFVDPISFHNSYTGRKLCELVIGDIGLNFCFVDDLHMNHRKIVGECLNIESDKELAFSLFLGKKNGCTAIAACSMHFCTIHKFGNTC